MSGWNHFGSMDHGSVLVKFQAEGKIFEITRTIHSNSERSEHFLVTEWGFLTCFWRFLISDNLEQFEFKLEKIIEIQKYRISANSCRDNYSFFESWVRQLFKGDNYSKEESINFLVFGWCKYICNLNCCHTM